MAATAVVCPGQFFSPSPEAAAKVIALNGQVSVLHDMEPFVLNVGDTVQVKQVIVTGPDGYAKFQVTDGSTFDVYPNSNVTFRSNPGNLRDLLDVLVGKVKIHIQKWGGQPNPNKVYTPTAVISVRGTTFDVVVDEDEETTIVSVEEGVVDVRHKFKGDSRTLNAGDTITVYKNEPLSQSFVDRGEVFRRVLRAGVDALTRAIASEQHGGVLGTGGGTVSGGGSGQGQTAPPPAPSPPPPPPPPPGH